MLNDAIGYAKLGIAVFPLAPLSKIPLKGTRGVKDATTDIDQIKRWWLAEPHANIGVALGKISGVVAIDFDFNHGATKDDLKKFPRTVTVQTRNGFHLFYKNPESGVRGHTVLSSQQANDKSGAATLRSDGQYVVAAPSRVLHPDGAEWEYSYLSDAGGELVFGDLSPAELPSFCLDTSNSSKSLGSSLAKEGYPPNTRHDMYVRTATGMWADGAGLGEIRKALFKRNAEECKPPKPIDEFEKEVEAILDWIVVNVEKKNVASKPSTVTGDANVCKATIVAPLIQAGATTSREPDTHQEPDSKEYIIPLGYRGKDYFYTSSDNQNVLCLSGASHNSGGLLQLMPYEYWLREFGKTSKDGNNTSIDWIKASGALMDACRDYGYFEEDKIRGVGAWLDKDGSLILHCGDRLIKNGTEFPLNGLEDGHIYQLGARHEISNNALPLDDCRDLLVACSAPAWRDASYAKLLAGGLSVLRLCGALRWRPMFWLTGASGSGKSTLMECIVDNMAGSWGAYVQGQATEAGIRQTLRCSSRPVIFDEAETTDKESAKRVKRVVELARQGSSMSGGKIVKGTPGHSAVTFTVNSSFFLSSIRVNLTEEADLNRFCLLELGRPSAELWPAVEKAMDPITPEYCDRLFARYIAKWDLLMATRAVFETAIVANGEDMRRAQQYSIILAGYWLLTSDAAPSLDEAKELSLGMVQHQRVQMEQEKDESLCLEHLKQPIVRSENGDRAMEDVIKAHDNQTLYLYGLFVKDGCLYVKNSHEQLRKIYAETRWANIWRNALARLPGATKCKPRIMGSQPHCVSVPLSVVIPE